MSLLGQRIGNIRIDALLGKGGMGEVYRGFDVRLERHVAIKTLRSRHRLESEAKARFLREARILSRLESSVICQVYDLLEGEDADYLIFEYVEGETLRQLLERKRLEMTSALMLAEKIARALAVAHQERIVHRDLKPENVMVTPGGEIKILDFGISHAVRDVFPGTAAGVSMHLELGEEEGKPQDTAALTGTAPVPEGTEWDEEGLEKTELFEVAPTVRQPTPTPKKEPIRAYTLSSSLDARLTQDGAVIGTLAFMSPEQATGEELTEASDMFSFGLLLQEMVTGEPAYEPAPLPMLLPLVARGETCPIRGSDIDPDAVRLVEDLLRFKPEQRPSSAEAADRLRWILDRPKRRLRQKRRNQLASAAIAFLLVVLAVVSVLAVRASHSASRAAREAVRAENEAHRANAQAERANLEASRTQEVVDFLVDLFEAASPESAQGREVGVREILAQGSERIDRELRAQPLVRARLKDTLGTIHRQLGDYDEAERLLTAALEIRREHLPKTSAERAQSKQQLAALLADQGRLELAEPLLRDAARALEGAPAELPALASVLNDLATLMFESGKFSEAEALYERSLELREQAFGKRSDEVADGLNNLAVLAWQLGDYPRAEALYGRSLSIQEEVLGENHPNLAALLNNLGILHREMGEPETAERLHRRALGIAEKALGGDHPDVAAILDSLARLLLLHERLEDAEPLFERAYAIRAEVLGADSYEVGRTLTSLGDLLRRRGELPRAAAMLRRARRLLREALGEEHPWTLKSTHSLANVHRDRGEKEEAAALYQQALTTGIGLLGADHPEVRAIRRDQRRLYEDPRDPPAPG